MKISQLSSYQIQLSQNDFQFIDHREEAEAIIIDIDKLENNPELWGNSKVIVISNRPAGENLYFLSKTGIRHLIGFNSANLNQEIEECLKQMAGGPKWGPEHYLGQNAQILSEGIDNTRSIETNLEIMLDQLDYSQYFSSPKSYLHLMSNELLTNAFYNATLTKEKLFAPKTIDRKNEVILKGAEHILFKVGISPTRVGVSVQDSFGGLTYEGVIKGLLRGEQEKTPNDGPGGAGLGLYLTYHQCHQLVMNVRPGRRTEVICLIEASKRFKQYKERIPSFHFYLDEVESGNKI